MKKILVGISCMALMIVLMGASVDKPTSSDFARIRVTNGSKYNITEFYVGHTSETSWGENLLDSPLGPGETVVLSVECELWDILLVDEDGFKCDIREVALCEDESWSVPDLSDCHNN